MVKGKSWSPDEEQVLRRLIDEGKTLAEIAALMGKSREAVRQKKLNLGLCTPAKEQKTRLTETHPSYSSCRLDTPPELPTVEKALELLASAMLKIMEPGISRDEVRRLQAAADLAQRYKQNFADYQRYRLVEQRLTELETKYRNEHENKKKKPDMPNVQGEPS
jgi:hypothetical protein